MKYSAKNKTFTRVLLVVIWCSFCTLLNSWVPFTARRGVILLIGSFLALLWKPSFIQTKYFIFLLFYALIVIANHLLGDSYFKGADTMQLEIVLLFFSLFLSYWFLRDGYSSINAFMVSFLVILGITTIGTFIADRLLPGAVRQVTALSFYGETSMMRQFYRIGMTNYSLPHALPMLIPPVVMGLKYKGQNKGKKILNVIILLSIFSLIILSGASIPLILAFIATMVSVIISPNMTNGRIAFIVAFVVLTVPFLIFDDLLVSLLSNVIDIFEANSDIENSIADRMSDVRDLVATGSAVGDVESRSNLYQRSIKSFLSNPILGTDSGFGGHSSFLDRLASLGIIGVFPLFAVIMLNVREVASHLSKNTAIYYYIGLFTGFSMLVMKNMMNIEMLIILFFYLPLFTLWMSNQPNQEVNK